MINSNYKLLLAVFIFMFLGVIAKSSFLIFVGIIIIFIFFLRNKKSTPGDADFWNTIRSSLDSWKHNIKVTKVNNSNNSNQTNSKPMDTMNSAKVKKIVWISTGAVVALILFFKSVIMVPAGYVGVYHLFGKVSDRVLNSGLHLVNPLGGVENLTVRTVDYTMSIAPNEGKKQGDDSIYALTKEGLSVSMDITVLYHLLPEKASAVYRNIGTNYEEIVIRPEIRSAIRDTAADYEAKEIYSDKRVEAGNKILERLKANIEPRGILVEEVLVRNVQLPDKLAASIEAKLQADQEAQQYDFILQKETKEAERKRIEAAGQRDSQKIISEGMTPSYLQYLYINSLKDRQGTIYVPINPSNGMPLFKGL